MTYKSIPYGTIDEALPYLSRRLNENSSILGGVRREREIIRAALSRRLFSPSNLMKRWPIFIRFLFYIFIFIFIDQNVVVLFFVKILLFFNMNNNNSMIIIIWYFFSFIMNNSMASIYFIVEMLKLILYLQILNKDILWLYVLCHNKNHTFF